jgi:hypothetical protein
LATVCRTGLKLPLRHRYNDPFIANLKESRYAYFANALNNLNKAPSDFPDALKKRKRVLEVLEKAPPPPPKVWTKPELQEQALKDKQTQNAVKVKLSGLMDLLKKRYQRFRKSIIVHFQPKSLIVG